jgi:hypothetical protein
VNCLDDPRANCVTKTKKLKIPPSFLVCFLLYFFAANSASAVDPSRHISQYAHTAWRIQDGVFSGAPNAITQTMDDICGLERKPVCCASMAFVSSRGLLRMESICRPLISLLFWGRVMGVYGSGWKVV